jgi:cobalt-zinc-cadmium efflux system outer membrane protein
MKPALSIAALLILAVSTARAGDFLTHVRRAPEAVAASALSEADQLRVSAAGRWADPQLEGMVAEKDTPEESMPMWEVSLQQPLPAWGERGARRALARARAAMSAAEADEEAGRLAAEVARMLAENKASGQRIRLLQSQRERMDRMRAALETRAGSGQGRLGDVLALQSRLTALDLEVERESRMAEEAAREARQLLGLDETASLPEFEAPAPRDLKPEQTPALRRNAAAQDEARAMAAMARSEARPMTAFGLRFEREETGLGDEDTLGITLMTDLPWNRRRAARTDERAARAVQTGRAAEADAQARRLSTDLAKAERWSRQAEQTRQAAMQTRQRVEQELNALANAAGASGMADGTTVLMLLELWERCTELDMNVIEADLTAHYAQAALWRHASILTGEKHE